MKAQVKLDLASMSATDKTFFAKNFGNALLNNGATFPHPPKDALDMMDFSDSCNGAIQAAEAAKAAYREALSNANDMLAELEGFVRQNASYVGQVANGSAAIIELAGLPVRKTPGRVGPLDAPTGLTAEPMQSAGMVQLRWQPNRLAKVYQVQIATDMSFPAATTKMQLASRGKATLYPLASATRFWIRIAAVNAAGPDNWSSAVSVVTQ